MRGVPAALWNLVESGVKALGFELVEVELGGGRQHQTLRVYIDGPHGITVDNCADVSRQLSAVLDVEDPIPGTYTLEVSSPGIDRPLTRPKDYSRWAGHLARVETAEPIDGRRRFKGTLLGLSDGEVRLRLEDGTETAVPFTAVTRAKLEMTDALIEEHRLAQQGASQAH